MRRVTPLPSHSPVRWARRGLCAVAVVCALGVTGAMHPEARTPLMNVAAAKPAAHEESRELLQDVISASPAVHENSLVEVAAAPSAHALPGPMLRGVYVGAAKTELESAGRAHIVWLEVTGYCPCEKCCGPHAQGVTASGKPVSYHDGIFVAADPSVLPFGTRVRVPGYHDAAVAEVIDKGSAITGQRLDVFFPTHEQAEEWGRQWLAVRVERN